jgi:hypothetical protein
VLQNARGTREMLLNTSADNIHKSVILGSVQCSISTVISTVGVSVLKEVQDRKIRNRIAHNWELGNGTQRLSTLIL